MCAAWYANGLKEAQRVRRAEEEKAGIWDRGRRGSVYSVGTVGTSIAIEPRRFFSINDRPPKRKRKGKMSVVCSGCCVGAGRVVKGGSRRDADK